MLIEQGNTVIERQSPKDKFKLQFSVMVVGLAVAIGGIGYSIEREHESVSKEPPLYTKQERDIGTMHRQANEISVVPEELRSEQMRENLAIYSRGIELIKNDPVFIAETNRQDNLKEQGMYGVFAGLAGLFVGVGSGYKISKSL